MIEFNDGHGNRVIPPAISMSFNKYLLMTKLQRILHRVDTQIKVLAKKKLTSEQVGRRKDFIMLLMRFNEVYERKKVEEADYQAEIKEKIKKRSYLPTSSGTCIFRRVQP